MTVSEIRRRLTAEVAVKDLKIDEFGRGPQLPDGMNLCAGCEDVFTLGKYCAFCQAVHEALVDRYDEKQKTARIQMGVVPVAEYDPGKPASRIAVGVVFVGALCSAMFVLTGLWYAGRGLVGICLEHSR